jgi:hypothetical protein
MILYAARTQSGVLKGFTNEPKYDKYKDKWFCFKSGFGLDVDLGIFMGDLFSEITYKNSPKRVELNVVNNVDDDIDFFDDEERNFQKIDIYHLRIGDYILIECEGSFGGSSYLRIEDMQTRYDEYNGKPYIVIFDEEGEAWSSKTGECLSNPNTFYCLTGYYRKI